MILRKTKIHNGYQETRFIDSSKATKRSQTVLFQTSRRNILFEKKFPMAGSVLGYIASFSKYCYIDNLKIMACKLGIHEHTIRRCINYLVRVGLIIKKYCRFKKLRLETVSADDQKRLIDNPMGQAINLLYQALTKKRKKNYALKYDRAREYEPSKSYTRENQDTGKKSNFIERTKGVFDKALNLSDVKRQQMEAYKKMFNLS